MITLGDVISVVLAVVLGGAIGMEREVSGKAAGLRTNVLICLGATVFTIVSRQMALQYNDSVARIAAQIVTGVGFIGAGAIIQDRGGIHGLTTAATIWLVASIGMACGAHFYRLAVLTTLVAIIVLIGLAKLENLLESLFPKRKPKNTADDQSK
jgi:putative Mg2+ transporter-C (MgtC) family protein